jgi:hypothetical protein
MVNVVAALSGVTQSLLVLAVGEVAINFRNRKVLDLPRRQVVQNGNLMAVGQQIP